MGKRNVVLRLLHAKDDKDTIVTWKQDLTRVLHIFNVRSVGSASRVSVHSLLLDRAGNQYPHASCGYPSECVGSGRCLGKHDFSIRPSKSADRFVIVNIQ